MFKNLTSNILIVSSIIVVGCKKDLSSADLSANDDDKRTSGFVHYFHMKPQNPRPGETLKISWDVPGGKGLSIGKKGAGGLNLAGSSDAFKDNLPARGEVTFKAAGNEIFFLSGTDRGGRRLQQEIDAADGQNRNNNNGRNRRDSWDDRHYPPCWIRYLNADRLAVKARERTYLRWVTEGECISAVLDDSLRGQKQVNCRDGWEEIYPERTTHYTLTVYCKDWGSTLPGTTGPTNTDRRDVSVEVVFEPTDPANPNYQSPIINSFQSPRQVINSGEGTSLSWDVSHAQLVTISNVDSFSLGLSGSVPVSPIKTTTYVLNAKGFKSELITSVPITIRVNATPIIDFFRATPPSIVTGGSTNLGWSIQRCQWAEVIGPGGTRVACSGNLRISPPENTTYTIKAYGADNSEVSQFINVEVVKLPDPPASPSTPISDMPVLDSFYVTAPSLMEGQTTRMIWRTINAARLEISNDQNKEVTKIPENLVSYAAIDLKPSVTTKYTLTIWSASGKTLSNSIVVAVSNPVTSATISYFYASTGTVAPGGAVTIFWKSAGGSKIVIDGVNQPQLAESGFIEVKPQATTTYTLKVLDATGSKPAVASLTVKVVSSAEMDLLNDLNNKMKQ